MDKKALITAMIDTEWDMFHNVNGDTRANCQENRIMFEKMRGAQYEVWNYDVCSSYYQDLLEAKAAGRNLPREKYIHMMASTAPADYEIVKAELPEITENKKKLAQEIWEIIGAQTDKLREEYPLIALGGRPLHTADEARFPGSTSVETYQKGELLTYSENTLSLLLDQIRGMQKEGKSYAHDVQLASVLAAGYTSLKNAEEVMLKDTLSYLSAEQVEQILKDNTGCPNCKMPE